MKTHPGKIRQMYKDKYIEKMIPSHDGAKKVFIKTDEKNFNGFKEIYKCTACDSQFKSGAGVSFHLATVHEGLKPTICSDCTYDAKTVSALNHHIEKVHEGIKENECEYCHAKFRAKSSLEYHIDKFHAKKQPYQGNKCTECDASFATNCSLKSHIDSVHRGLKPFQCEFCDKCFSLKGNLKAHIRR